MLTARILIRSELGAPGEPAVLDVLDHLAQRPGEIALLHAGPSTASTAGGPLADPYRYSIIACEPVLTIEVDHTGQARWITPTDLRPDAPTKHPDSQNADPLAVWQSMVDSVALDASALPGPLPIGWIGGISYDIGRHIETLPATAPDDLRWPLLRWSLYDSYFLFDHAAGRWTIATMEWSALRGEPADRRLDRLVSLLLTAEPAEDPDAPPARGRLVAGLSRHAYAAKVQKVRDYIAAGDIYQANLAQRWTVETRERPERIFRHLVRQSPAPYATFLRFDESRAVIGASPELFLQRTGAKLVTRPIKGTRPRRPADPVADEALQKELLDSAKDRAELAMIVDLLRNDLGRICQYGSVRVIDPRQIERHPTVWHTVATIAGQLATPAGEGWASILRALCPGGSITGAPKIRAMEIIEELEGVRRNWYCGNFGWIGPRDTGAMNIAIRTIFLEGPKAYVWAGGGVVADSETNAEYDETTAKAAALMRALRVEDFPQRI